MSMSDSNKYDDTDILRAEDIVPPYNTNANQKWILREDAAFVEQNVSSNDDWDQRGDEVPKFDLAAQIMAEQRKITGVRRKAPGQKAKTPNKKPQTQSNRHTIKPTILSEEEKIIAEIVAGDIQKLCWGDKPALLI
ncbi:MAG: hypothetical protein PVJ60_06195 [Phycisphaerales bacterium]|jgi:hypothetical protein